MDLTTVGAVPTMVTCHGGLNFDKGMKRRLCIVLEKGSIVIVMALVLLAGAGFGTEVYSQENIGAPKNSSGQESKKTRFPTRPSQYPAALAGLEILADLTVSPATYGGPCPASLTFNGKITVNRPATVHYRFIRSDDTRKHPGVLTFDKPGTKEVTDTWQLGEAGGSAELNGWSAIQVSFPMKAQSNTAYFKGRCSEGGQSPAVGPSGQGKASQDPDLAPPPPPPRKAAPVKQTNPLSGIPKAPKEDPAKQPASGN
jgi:hypothetical protein